MTESMSARGGGGARIRLLALDLDGTLLDSEWKLSETNCDALDRCHRLGIEVAIVTGRRYSAARKLTTKLDFEHHLITNAGAMTSTRTDRGVRTCFWARELLAGFMRHVARFEGHTFFISDCSGREEIRCTRPNGQDPHVARYVSLNAESMMRLDSFEEGLDDVLQVAFMGTEARMNELETRIATFAGANEISCSGTRYPDRDFALVDAVRKDANKKNALEKLVRSLDIERAAVMAIGDNYADEEMLEYASYPIAMGNAPAAMRQRWPVTATNDEDGVARAVEALIPRKPQKQQ